MEQNEIVSYLREKDLLETDQVIITPLSGGVSSDIHLVTDGETSLVLKRALPKLRVKDNWFAGTSRNHYEQEYMKYVGAFLPEAVPKILYSDAQKGFFVMEYLSEGYANWKELLLAGRVESTPALEAARILGTIHNHAWGDADAQAKFNSNQNFLELRIEPYLLATAKSHPDVRVFLETEAKRLQQTALSLVHGDYSPKNILLSSDRFVILDCEVAWYGDPAFDVAFMMNHFLLKSLHFAPNIDPFLDLISLFWDNYQQILHAELLNGLEERVARLLLMLFLARVDGKSPAEYVTQETQKNLVRHFVKKLLPQGDYQLSTIMSQWRAQFA